MALLATGPDRSGAPPPPVSKKQAYLASKAATRDRGRPARRGARAQAVVFARNLHTHEIMPLEGPGIGPDAYVRFFRCWFTGATTDLAPELVARVVETANEFGAQQVHIISAFRHPKYNLWLRKKGREVASRSQHTVGQAIDFALPGVPVLRIYRHLLSVHPGGVGLYPVSAFVHVDLGRKRTWRGT